MFLWKKVKTTKTISTVIAKREEWLLDNLYCRISSHLSIEGIAAHVFNSTNCGGGGAPSARPLLMRQAMGMLYLCFQWSFAQWFFDIVTLAHASLTFNLVCLLRFLQSWSSLFCGCARSDHQNGPLFLLVFKLTQTTIAAILPFFRPLVLKSIPLLQSPPQPRPGSTVSC